ncbi:MAG: NCS2 family permease [Proteobacteria bacterium]|nr:NCS2 family permease [Pseudomonadota bacterium]
MVSIDRFFGISATGSSISKEVRAGVTTFLAMSYIIFVNPQILSQAIQFSGTDVNATAELLSATVMAAAFGSIFMGIFSKYPIAVAPGMGLNAYFVFAVVLGSGATWQTALGAVFVSGIVFLMLSLTGFREAVINAIPLTIKRSIATGIGLFLAMIGMTSSGLIVSKESTVVGLGNLNSASVSMMLFGLLMTIVLTIRKIPGALLISMLGVSSICIVFKLPVYNGKVFEGDVSHIISSPVWPGNLIGSLDLNGALSWSMSGVVLTFLFVAFFDTAGTLIGLSEKAKFVDSEGRIARSGRVFIADAFSIVVGAFLGTSTTTAYVESAAGIEEGGKTGFVAVVVGLLFLLSLFFWPLASMIPSAATAPALILLGAMMMESVSKIAWDDFSESIPAFLTIVSIPLTWSISTGIAFGVISYVLIRLMTKRYKELNPVMLGLVIILGVKIIWS